MTHKVVFTRTRVIEEKVSFPVSSSDPDDAIAAAKHMLENDNVDWRFKKTLSSTEPQIQVVTEIKR